MNDIQETFELLPVGQILPNPDQPRLYFDQDELFSLSESILEHGLLQPIRVEGPFKQDGSQPVYFLVDGERRLRATKLAKIETIKAVVCEPMIVKDDKKLVGAIIANLQRSDLNAIEEGKAFEKLRQKGWLIRNIVVMTGRSAGYVELRLKMLEFEPEVQELFAMRLLSMDPAVVYGLFKLPEAIRTKMAARFAQKGMSTVGIRLEITKIGSRYGKDKDRDLTKSKSSPAMELSEKPAEISRLFAMLAKDGITPVWSLIENAAKETCKECNIADMASTQMCKDCPAVELVKRLTKLATDQEGSVL